MGRWKVVDECNTYEELAKSDGFLYGYASDESKQHKGTRRVDTYGNLYSFK